MATASPEINAKPLQWEKTIGLAFWNGDGRRL
jgi:hypothetical protein